MGVITQPELENVLLTLNDLTAVGFNVEWLRRRVHEVKALVNKEALEILRVGKEEERNDLQDQMSQLKAELANIDKDLEAANEGVAPNLSSLDSFLKGLL